MDHDKKLERIEQAFKEAFNAPQATNVRPGLTNRIMQDLHQLTLDRQRASLSLAEFIIPRCAMASGCMALAVLLLALRVNAGEQDYFEFVLADPLELSVAGITEL